MGEFVLMLTSVEFSEQDFKNFLFWYNRSFKDERKPTIKDQNTLTKVKAFIISNQEDQEEFLDI